jgi:hypothetical protein
MSNLHDSRTVVGDGLPAILINHQQIPAIGTQCGFDDGLDSETGIDVGNNLALALGSIGSCAGTRVWLAGRTCQCGMLEHAKQGGD